MKLNIAAWIAVGLFAIWVFLPLWKVAPVCPPAAAAPAPVENSDGRQERLVRALCDKEVEILLQSRDLADLIRAATVIHQVNCDIESRL
jgi:hypothetical protein